MSYFVQDIRGDNAGSFGQLPRNPTWQQVQDLFGFRISSSDGWDATPPGQACWRFMGVVINEGPAVYRVVVKNSESAPYPEPVVVFHHWPGAPTLPGVIRPPYYNNGEASFTETGGDKTGLVEFPYGGGSVVGTDGGPDSFWVSAGPNGKPPQYSDLADNFGWLGGTTHLNPSPVFQYQVKPTTPPPPTGDYYLQVVVNGEVVGRITVQEIPAGDNYLGLWRGDAELGRVAFD